MKVRRFNVIMEALCHKANVKKNFQIVISYKANLFRSLEIFGNFNQTWVFLPLFFLQHKLMFSYLKLLQSYNKFLYSINK